MGEFLSKLLTSDFLSYLSSRVATVPGPVQLAAAHGQLESAIAERKRIEEQLRESETRLRETERIAQIGSWEWELLTDIVQLSEESYRIFATCPDTFGGTFAAFIASVHPDDREIVAGLIQSAYQTHESFVFEHRLRHPDGTVRTVQERGAVVVGECTVPVKMFGTVQDVTEHTHAEEERRAVARMKDEFISVVSHELRTPLTSIRGSLGLLASGVLGALPEKGQRMAEIAVNNADRLVRLINDMLDIERMGSGTLSVSKSESQAVQSPKSEDEKQKADTETRRHGDTGIEGQSPCPPFTASPRRTAPQPPFSNPQSAIRNPQLPAAERPLVLVCDDEPWNRDLARRLLEQRGYRVMAVASGQEAVEQAIVEHPAVVLLDLNMPGMDGWDTLTALKGRSETREIPVIIASSLSPQDTPHTPEAVDWLVKPLDRASLFQSLERVWQQLQDKAARVLIVEDDSDLAQVLIAMFQHQGIETLHARTQQEAIQLCQRLAPDLLVLDLTLPDGDGFGVVDWLRRQNQLHQVPLVVYSAKDLDDNERERLRWGQTRFFNKGRVRPEDFESQVVTLLGQVIGNHTVRG